MSSRRAVTALLLLASTGGCAHTAVLVDRDRASLEATVAATPGQGEAWRDLAWLAWLEGDVARARVAFARGIELLPADPRVHLGVAALAHEAGAYDLARDGWTRLLERASPDDPWTPLAAEVAVARLDALVGEVGGEAAFAERLSRLDPRRLGGEVEYRLLGLRAALLRRLGDEAAAKRLDLARGCPARIAVAGPFGHLPHLDLSRPLPPSPSHEIGGRFAVSRGGWFPIQIVRRGVAHATTWVELPRDLVATITVETGEPWQLVVDQRTVFRQEPSDRYPPRATTLALPLAAGVHRVVLKLAVPHERLEVALSLRGPDGPLRTFEVAPTARRGDEPSADATGVVTPGPAVSGRLALVADLLLALRAYRDGDADAAAAPSARLVARAPRFVPGLLVAAQLAAEDPTRPARFARDRARQLLERALELDPQASRARYNLATMELQEDHAEKALERLADAPGWRMAYGRYQALHARGFHAEAERALADARRQGPEACPPIEADLARARDDHDLPRARALGLALRRCAPLTDDYAELLRDAHEPAAAAAEYRRLLELDPSRESVRAGLAEVLVAADDLPGAITVLSALTQDHPRTARYRVKLADALLASGRAADRAPAKQVLLDGVAESPEAADLHRARLGVGEPGPLDPFRVDGVAVIAAFERSHRGYESPAVIVLDRTVTRVFPTGARLTLTHNIIRVQTKDGIDKWGEVQIPDGADVLLLRAVKADHTTREPEDIAGKDTVSVPDLAPGDYVEFEYVDPAAPPGAFPGGFLAERFYFQSFDAPLDRTEYVVATPSGMAVQLDRRGDAPAATLSSRDGLDVRTFAGQERPQLLAEPQQAPYAETAPSVRVGSGLSLSAWRRYLEDQQFGALRTNPELRQLAAELGRGRDGAATVAAIDTWVRRNVQGSGAIDEAATAILAAREGNRVTITQALLAAAGVSSQLGLVRPAADPALDGPLPDLEGRREPVLVLAGTPLRVLDPRFRHAATFAVTPALRGQGALLLGDHGEALATIPARHEDRRRIELTARLEGDGSAEVTVRETLTGWPALEWREGLDRIAEDRVRAQFEQHTLGFYFPGATLASLTYQPRDADGEPLLVEYRFRAPRFARAEAGRLVVPAPFPALLAKRYVGVGHRTAPLLLQYTAPTEIEAIIQLPAGAKVIATAPAVQRDDQGLGEFSQTVTIEGESLRLRSRFAMPNVRLAPGRYGELVAHAQRVDAAEARAAEVAPR